MVVGIEIGYRRIQDDLLLQLLQRRRRAAADHQCASFYVFFSDKTFFGEGIIRPADKIDVTVKQIVYKDIRDAFHLGFGGKQDAGLWPDCETDQLSFLPDKNVLSDLLISMVIPWGLQPHDPLIKSRMGIRELI